MSHSRNFACSYRLVSFQLALTVPGAQISLQGLRSDAESDQPRSTGGHLVSALPSDDPFHDADLRSGRWGGGGPGGPQPRAVGLFRLFSSRRSSLLSCFGCFGVDLLFPKPTWNGPTEVGQNPKVAHPRCTTDQGPNVQVFQPLLGQRIALCEGFLFGPSAGRDLVLPSCGDDDGGIAVTKVREPKKGRETAKWLVREENSLAQAAWPAFPALPSMI